MRSATRPYSAFRARLRVDAGLFSGRARLRINPSSRIGGF